MTQGTSIEKAIVVGILLFFVSIGISPCVAETQKGPASQGNWLYVGGSGPGNYTRIRDAIDNASEGDTVYVFHGTYNESLAISKSLTILGEDKNTTIIDGQHERTSIVQLKTCNIYFSGFSLIHSSFYTNGFGLSISSDSSYNIVTNNIIAENQGFWGGIFIEGDTNQINNNTLRSNSGRGILISYTATNNIISENDISGSPRGIWVSSCRDNIITKNHIHNNSWQGIWLAATKGNEISDNTIENNGEAAFYIESDASHDMIKENIIKNNGNGLVILDSESLTITMNFFYGQGIHFKSTSLNHWTSHTINDNLINDKPLYFYKSESGLVVPSDAGQVILADCSNCHIKNVTISNVDYGIQLGFSSENTISNNRIFNSNCGVFIDAFSESNTIHDNIINNTHEYGIYLKGSYTTIHKNSFENNDAGIYIDFSYNNTISENNFINNSQYHIYYLVHYLLPKNNKFTQNYYDDAGLFIKIIIGKVKTRFTCQFVPGEITNIYRPGFIIDWHPAHEPYAIKG